MFCLSIILHTVEASDKLFLLLDDGEEPALVDGGSQLLEHGDCEVATDSAETLAAVDELEKEAVAGGVLGDERQVLVEDGTEPVAERAEEDVGEVSVSVENGVERDDGLEAELPEDLKRALEVLLEETGLLEREKRFELIGDELEAGVEEDRLELVPVADDTLEVGQDLDHGRLFEVGHEQAAQLAHHVVDLVRDVFLDLADHFDVVVADLESFRERRDLDALGVLAKLDERVGDRRELQDLRQTL